MVNDVNVIWNCRCDWLC